MKIAPLLDIQSTLINVADADLEREGELIAGFDKPSRELIAGLSLRNRLRSIRPRKNGFHYDERIRFPKEFPR